MEAWGTSLTAKRKKRIHCGQSFPVSLTNLHSILLRVPLNFTSNPFVWGCNTEVDGPLGFSKGWTPRYLHTTHRTSHERSSPISHNVCTASSVFWGVWPLSPFDNNSPTPSVNKSPYPFPIQGNGKHKSPRSPYVWGSYLNTSEGLQPRAAHMGAVGLIMSGLPTSKIMTGCPLQFRFVEEGCRV